MSQAGGVSVRGMGRGGGDVRSVGWGLAARERVVELRRKAAVR